MRSFLTSITRSVVAGALVVSAATLQAGAGPWVFLGRTGGALLAVNLEGGAQHAPPIVIGLDPLRVSQCRSKNQGRLLVGPPGQGSAGWLAYERGAGIALLRVDERCRTVETESLRTRHRAEQFTYGADRTGHLWAVIETVDDQQHYLESFRRKGREWQSAGTVIADVITTPRPDPAEREGIVVGWWRFAIARAPEEWRGQAPLEAIDVFTNGQALLAVRWDVGRIEEVSPSGRQNIPPPYDRIDTGHSPELIRTTGDEPVIRWGDGTQYHFARLHRGQWTPIAMLPYDSGFGGMVVYNDGALVSLGGTADLVDVRVLKGAHSQRRLLIAKPRR